MQLNNSLPAPGGGNVAAGNALFVTNGSLVAGEEMNFTWVVAEPNHALVVVLTWYDPPADLAQSKLLLNDLDLLVVTDDTTAHGEGVVHLPNDGDEPDEDNNVERVVLRSPLAVEAGGNLTIVIKAATVRTRPRRVAAPGARDRAWFAPHARFVSLAGVRSLRVVAAWYVPEAMPLDDAATAAADTTTTSRPPLPHVRGRY